MCSVKQHQRRRRQMCGKSSQIHPEHWLFLCYKKIACFDWTIYLWQAFNSFGCPLMLRTNYRCVQSLNISADFAKWVENLHKFTKYTHFLSVAKNDLSCLNNLFMARFQLIRLSTYAKYKLQMCSVTQHQCERRQMWKICTNSHSTLTFCLVTKND